MLRPIRTVVTEVTEPAAQVSLRSDGAQTRRQIHHGVDPVVELRRSMHSPHR